MRVYLLILNYNGRQLLAECLPSVLRAAEDSRHQCEVAVIDNASTDDSLQWLGAEFPQLRVIRRPNRGLCSFNDVVPWLASPVAILLNNDVKLDPHCVDQLVAPLLDSASCFMTTPLCRRFDGRTYEGFKTAVCWRWGLVQATAFYEGHQQTIHQPALTASAGAVLAVDCRKFSELGGFDPLYLPGRLEDLDFAYRGYQAGYHARYVPAASAQHLGMATFQAVFGDNGCRELALRNTLLFQWKNLRHPRHLVRQLVGLPVRLALDVVQARHVDSQPRWAFARALLGAFRRLRQLRSSPYRVKSTWAREYEFFDRFGPKRIDGGNGNGALRPDPSLQARRARRYPISRWYLRPLAGRLAAAVAPTPIRPVHLTLCGLLAAGAAGAVLVLRGGATVWAAGLVLLYWFFDRADGQLARRQRTVSPWGAWLDGNVDELVDVGLHTATAAVVAAQTAASWPWVLLIAFLAGKYLFMYGLATEEHHQRDSAFAAATRTAAIGPARFAKPDARRPAADCDPTRGRLSVIGLVRKAYHFPANADARTHLLALALCTGLLVPELILVATYYNLRWLARYGLVARRLGGGR